MVLVFILLDFVAVAVAVAVAVVPALPLQNVVVDARWKSATGCTAESRKQPAKQQFDIFVFE